MIKLLATQACIDAGWTRCCWQASWWLPLPLTVTGWEGDDKSDSHRFTAAQTEPIVRGVTSGNGGP